MINLSVQKPRRKPSYAYVFVLDLDNFISHIQCVINNPNWYNLNKMGTMILHVTDLLPEVRYSVVSKSGSSVHCGAVDIIPFQIDANGDND